MTKTCFTRTHEGLGTERPQRFKSDKFKHVDGIQHALGIMR